VKIAVITPYWHETSDVLTRCRLSVSAQTHADYRHIMVADGNPHPIVSKWPDVDHMVLPCCHADAGATPRALAAISAFSQGYDAVAFLDADNTYEPNHLELMVKTIGSQAVATATRTICTRLGTALYIDTIESTGEDFCDTNCLFLTAPSMHCLVNWITEPSLRLWSDRKFWHSILQANLSRVHCKIPSVNYHSRWAWHYQHAGLIPPTDSVWIAQQNGNLHTYTHAETTR
jgi:hypothetical protein